MATTRIETMLGDTAIAVHPQDTKYKVQNVCGGGGEKRERLREKEKDGFYSINLFKGHIHTSTNLYSNRNFY